MSRVKHIERAGILPLFSSNKLFLNLFLGICFSGYFSLAYGVVREASGVNLTAQEGFGARYFSLSQTALGMRGDETALAHHPAAMRDVSHLWFTAEHVNRFGLANYDNFSATLPLDTTTTLGLGLARFGGTFEEYENNLSGGVVRDYSDYLLLVAFAKGWEQLDVGANLKLLYRNIAQTGIGIQGDLSARYNWFLNWSKAGVPHVLSTNLLIKGVIPSTARWESELLEYEPSDIQLGIGYEFYSRSLKGEYAIAFQTRGLIYGAARSTQFERGDQAYKSPLGVLQTMHMGVESRLDMGITFRLGVQELGVHPQKLYPTYGIGYHYKGFLSLDYGYHLHPELEHTHRISLSFSPRWKSFSMTRPGTHRTSTKKIPTPIPRDARKIEPTVLLESEEAESLEPETAISEEEVEYEDSEELEEEEELE
jgi:hypothetical protein